MEEISFIMDVAKEAMEKSLDHLEKAFVNIRAGKANPAMLSTVKMEYYGAQTPLSQVANINTPDAQTLSVQPWDKTMIPEIEKAILVANLGFNPSNNGESVIINIPPLTEERRRELVKLAKSEAENAKVGVRNARKDANNELKNIDLSEDQLGNAEVGVQTLTDDYIKKIDDKYASKEDEIMTVWSKIDVSYCYDKMGYHSILEYCCLAHSPQSNYLHLVDYRNNCVFRNAVEKYAL